MNVITEYRLKYNLTQDEFAQEVKDICPGIEKSLVSKIEHGLCRPTKELEEYCTSHVATPKTATQTNEMGGDSIIYQSTLKSLLKRQSYLKVYELLKYASKEHPVTRSTLAIRADVDDRAVRKIIGALRKAGVRVVSRSDAKGYWIARSAEDYALIRSELLARVKDITGTIRAMDSAPCEGQIGMGDEIYKH